MSAARARGLDSERNLGCDRPEKVLVSRVQPGDVILNGDGVSREVVFVARGIQVLLYWDADKPPIYRDLTDMITVVRKVETTAARLVAQEEEIARLLGALTNSKAVAASRIAERDKIALDVMRERDEAREALQRVSDLETTYHLEPGHRLGFEGYRTAVRSAIDAGK